MVDWSKLPDLVAVVLLICAFVSVSRSNRSFKSQFWFIGSLMVALHFVAGIFHAVEGLPGRIVTFIAVGALLWAAEIFKRASVPYRIDLRSSYLFFVALLVTGTLYLGLLIFAPAEYWLLILAAALIGVAPLALALLQLRYINHPLRWITVVFYGLLSVYLLLRTGKEHAHLVNALLFTVYFTCAINFFWVFRRRTAGAFITVAGFLAWALVPVLSPLMDAYVPNVHIESEVWNLPVFLVALGMILLLLEDQAEHNKHLALHDPLTSLPNRRLFEDRLTSALDRARRTNTQTALLIIDLNHFKEVNDHFGHHVGDLLLQRVGAIFAGRLRRSDTIARTGGDEFSIILEEPVSRAEAKYVSRALLELLHEPLQLENQTVRIGASIGVAVFPEDAAEMEALCIAADKRMYEEKLRLKAQSRTEALPLANPLTN